MKLERSNHPFPYIDGNFHISQGLDNLPGDWSEDETMDPNFECKPSDESDSSDSIPSSADDLFESSKPKKASTPIIHGKAHRELKGTMERGISLYFSSIAVQFLQFTML